MTTPKRIDKELFEEELLNEFEGKLDSSTGTIPWERITNKPQLADARWRSPVATFNDLPAENNNDGDLRLVLNTNEVYTWNEPTLAWELIGANDTNIEWTHIQGKPIEFPPTGHTHTEIEITDIDKYTKSEVDNIVAGKSDINHGHSFDDITETDTKKIMTATERNKLIGIEAEANKYVHPATHSLDEITETLDKKIMNANERTKLEGIEAGANKYIHPSTHSPGIISQDASNRFVTDTEKASWNSKAEGIHGHAIADVSNLQLELNSKASIDHDHDGRYYRKLEVDDKLSFKANNTDVLSKTNTAEYIPSSSYHPATKKYVDDSVASAGGGDMLKSQYDTDGDGKVNAAETADSVPWLGVTDKPTTFTPSSHNHTLDEVTETTTKKIMTADERTKLTGIETDANNYVHPATHPPSIISQDANNRFVTDDEKTAWNGKEDAFSKNTAFNKNFGTVAGTVCEGNDARLSDARVPIVHGNDKHSEEYLVTPFHKSTTPPVNTNLLWIDIS